MSKFNHAGAFTAKPGHAQSPVTSEPTPSTRTHEGAPGYLRDTKSELFLLAVANMVGEHTFYENAQARDTRYEQLVQAATLEDPNWTARLLAWLRGEGNLRSASLVGAAVFTKTRMDAGLSGLSRQVIASVLQRADEPGEMLAYWTGRYGRAIPKPVKRGVADAVRQLYTERAVLKYDTDARGYRCGDVLELVHAAPARGKRWQGDLFEHVIDRRHGRDKPIPETLRRLRERARLMDIPVAERAKVLRSWGGDATGYLYDAGMTWEALAGWLQGPMDATAWEAIIPSMGYMALLRNLRNFDEAGVSDEVAERVAAKLADPGEITRARQLPFRFWAAYKHTQTLRWGHALEKGLSCALRNVPALDKRTLILIDRSPSMFPGYPFSTANKSDITLAEQAAVFGAALALRATDATLVEFGMESRRITVPAVGSMLRLVEAFKQIDGTDIPSAVRQHYANHDRVVIVTDEQTRAGYLPSNMGGNGGMPETSIDALVPLDVPVYMWNMAGYRAGAAPSGGRNRHALGGLSDAAFRMIPLLEAGRDAEWPF